MSYRVELLALFRSLGKEISSFSSLWRSQASATVYDIALYEQGRVPDSVEVEAITGACAQDRVVSALGEFTRREGQAPGSVYRVPGVALCRDNLLPRLVAINARKDQLRQAIVAAAPTERARNTLVRRLFPGQNMLQVYRHIHSAESGVTRIAFSWSPVTSATTSLTQEEAQMLITTRLEEIPMEPEQQQAHEIALSDLGTRSAGSRVIQRRAVAPHPRMTLFYGRGRQAQKKTHHANLPLFISDEQPIQIGTLKSYDPASRRQTRSDQLQLIPLLRSQHLYLTQ